MKEREMLMEVTRTRMLGYANLLKDMAEVYLLRGGEQGEPANRTDLLTRRRIDAQRTALGSLISDASAQIQCMVESSSKENALAKTQEKRICKELLWEGISMKDYYRAFNRNGYVEIGMRVKGKAGLYYDVDDIAEVVSRVTHLDMVPLKDGQAYVRDEWVTLCFEEEVALQVYGGFAKVTKEEEEVSGDNYLMREFGDGTYIAAIADGMGSGEDACMDSENVLLLLEKHIETGVKVNSGIRVCDELLYVQHGGERSVSLDVMELNQYTGECRLYKNGSSSSFLIRKGKVKEYEADRLSLGVNPRVSGREEVMHLRSEDILLLASDGVMDLFYDNLDHFKSYLISLVGMSLSDMATNILRMAIQIGGGKIEDDMTILVIGVCEKEGLPVAF